MIFCAPASELPSGLDVFADDGADEDAASDQTKQHYERVSSGGPARDKGLLTAPYVAGRRARRSLSMIF